MVGPRTLNDTTSSVMVDVYDCYKGAPATLHFFEVLGQQGVCVWRNTMQDAAAVMTGRLHCGSTRTIRHNYICMQLECM